MDTDSRDLQQLARQASMRPFFLGYAFERIATQQGYSEKDIASSLGCDIQTLIRLRLCRAPDVSAPTFIDDVQQIAERYSIDWATLLSLVKEALIIDVMSKNETDDDSGWLMAARDRDDDDAL
jgi:transcriptional regulator with XRE-family HTH domain